MKARKNYQVAVLGGGHIGKAVMTLLRRYHGPWVPTLYDLPEVDLRDSALLSHVVEDNHIIISALPFFLTSKVAAEVAKQGNRMYFDFTEDLEVGRKVIWNVVNNKHRNNDEWAIVAPHCGLAPGAVSTIAYELMRKFDVVKDVKIRVGALPRSCDNPLSYYRSWSTNGLINEYLKQGEEIKNGQRVTTRALDDLNTVIIDGGAYEAFNTSGGAGTLLTSITDGLLSDICFSTSLNVNYQTLRYPGHCEKMRFLLWELEVPPTVAARIIDKTVPVCTQDVVVIHVEVKGIINNELAVRQYSNKIYGENGSVSGDGLTAIQLTTAGGALAVMEYAINNFVHTGNLILRNEKLTFDDIASSVFWRPYY